LRQAYDYWQNQPGNYPKPAGHRPEGEAPEETPREGRTLRELGWHEAHPAAGRPAHADAGRTQQAIQLPPLSSPSGGPQPCDRVFRPPRQAAYTTQEEGCDRQSAPGGGYRRKHSPQGTGRTVAINQPSTDPKKLPTNPRGSRASVPPKGSCSAHGGRAEPELT
jgi:hypothetical protein